VVKRILIADDSSLVRGILSMFLQTRKNVEVCGEAANGTETIEKAKLLRPDLVLLDLAMPEMNGAEVASILKKMMPNVHIIIFSMYSENIGRSLTSTIGVDMVISKPDGMISLMKAVDDVLSPGQPAGRNSHADS
jgi:DNA-binding NarL/FixJ family response regulator